LVLFPNCKINLGLRVTGKRADGYHHLDTVFYPLPFHDAAEINICSKPKKGKPLEFDLQLAGNSIPGLPENNLCTKAWKLIKTDFPDIPAVNMHLLKAIPTGAGLGGGSSNGAFTLMMLNDLFRLGLTTEELMNYALQLGSDCPFFILNKPCIASGRGEILNEIDLPITGYYFILVNPGIHIDTASAFSKLNHTGATVEATVGDTVKKPVTTWRNELMNDFEQPVFKEYPQLKDVKEKLDEAGAEYASMTGTGSCIYGIFSKETAVQNLQVNPEYKVYHINQGA
jgi:4-diphosphocytidyl-2-C-methyl-D-erythritol kinase